MHEQQPDTAMETPDAFTEGGEAQRQLQPRIYVASLADYNAGRLHGAWIDADQPAAGLEYDIAAMLAESKEPNAEEWAIHDFDDFGPVPVDEYASLGTVSRVACGIRQYGFAFAAYAAVTSIESPTPARFEAAYRGHWPSVEAYADELLRDVGVDRLLEEVPDWLRPYVQLDVAGFARDLELGGDIYSWAGPDGVEIFDAYV